MENKPITFIRELMKGKTEAEIQEVEQNFMDYLIVVKEIAEDTGDRYPLHMGRR